MREKAMLAVMAAAVCWGCIGLFSRQLSAAGLNALQITEVRCAITALGMVIWLLVRQPAALRIRVRDIGYFLGTGLLAIAFFNVCYFMTISLSTLSVAAILLYTAPSFVVLLSVVVFKEPFTRLKGISLTVATLGCVLVSGVGGFGHLPLTTLLWGLGAGLGYALYSIFGKLALRVYAVETVTAYTFIVAALGLLPFSRVDSIVQTAMKQPGLLLPMTLIALVCTMGAFLLYTWGLSHMEAGRAAVLAFVEPAVATLIGIGYFKEPFYVTHAMGIGLIFLSLWLLHMGGRRLFRQTP